MELSETRKALIEGLNFIIANTDVKLAIVLMLRTEGQMLTMMDYIAKHYNENPSEDEALQVAQLISEQIQ